MGFSSLGVSPPLPVTLQGSILSRAWLPVRTLSRRLLLRVFDRQRNWLDSLEPASPFEVCHLVVVPWDLRMERLWVTPRSGSAVASRLHLLFESSHPLPELPGSAVSVTASSRSDPSGFIPVFRQDFPGRCVFQAPKSVPGGTFDGFS
jgi:hypothetical protein